jgi:hypothetical protein
MSHAPTAPFGVCAFCGARLMWTEIWSCDACRAAACLRTRATARRQSAASDGVTMVLHFQACIVAETMCIGGATRLRVAMLLPGETRTIVDADPARAIDESIALLRAHVEKAVLR